MLEPPMKTKRRGRMGRGRRGLGRMEEGEGEAWRLSGRLPRLGRTACWLRRRVRAASEWARPNPKWLRVFVQVRHGNVSAASALVSVHWCASVPALVC